MAPTPSYFPGTIENPSINQKKDLLRFTVRDGSQVFALLAPDADSLLLWTTEIKKVFWKYSGSGSDSDEISSFLLFIIQRYLF